MDRDLLHVSSQSCWTTPKLCKLNVLFNKYPFCSQHTWFNTVGAIKNVLFSDRIINIFNDIFDNSPFQALVRMQIPSVVAKGKLLRHWAAHQINRLFLGITGKRENAKYIARTVEMEIAVLQWHSHMCPLPQRCELLESNLLHLLSVEEMQHDPGVPGYNCDCGLITQRILENPLQECSLCNFAEIFLLNKCSI